VWKEHVDANEEQMVRNWEKAEEELAILNAKNHNQPIPETS